MNQRSRSNTPKLFASFASLLLGCVLIASVAQAAPIGTVIFVLGDARITGPGGARPVRKGDPVNEGETIVTERNASVQLRMIDQGFIAVRPDTNMKFDEYRYTGREDGNERGLMSVVHGGFRTITGVIGRLNKQNYLVRTPTATIGIRGTDHEVIHIPVPAPGVQQIGQPGSYDKVNVGGAFIQTAVARVNVNANQVGYAPAPNQPPQLLPRIPEFFRATPPPAPRTAQQQQQQQQQAAQAAPESAAAEPVRETTVADSPQQVAAVVAEASVSTTIAAEPVSTPTTSTGTTGTTGTATGTSSTTTVQQSTAIVLTSSTGTQANLTEQTLTTSTGTTVPLTPTTNPAYSLNTSGTRTFGHHVESVLAVTTPAAGVEHAVGEGGAQPATDYLLDASKNLVQILDGKYEREGFNYLAQSRVAGVSTKFSGGTGADQFQTADGAAYFGRWEGGQIDYTGGLTFSQPLGLSSAHWGILAEPFDTPFPVSTGLQPINGVQNLIGSANYSLVNATMPTDAFGNLGTLNSASLSANFTSQTVVGTLDLAIAGKTLSAGGSGPIRGNGFDGFISGSCSGAGCPAMGYFGTVSGRFSGPAASDPAGTLVGPYAGVAYGFTPHKSPLGSEPYDDFITGVALLQTTDARTAGTQPSFPDNSVIRNRVYYTVPSISGTTPNNRYFVQLNPQSGTPAGDPMLASTNYLLSGSALARIHDTTYRVFDRGTPYAGTDLITPTGGGQLDHVRVSFGGTPAEQFSDATRGLAIGRYQGGVVQIENQQTGVVTQDFLGATSAHWTLNQIPPASLSLSGRNHYVRFTDASGNATFNTSPTDSYGNVGQLLGARLAVNFTGNVVSAGLRSSFAASGPGGLAGPLELGGYVNNIPLNTTGWTFSASSADANPFHVGCTGAGCIVGITYGGRLEGGLVGPSDSADGNKPNGGFFRYSFSTNFPDEPSATAQGRQFQEYYTGLVGFRKGPTINPPAPGSGTTNVMTSYLLDPVTGFPVRTASFEATPAGVHFDAGGNLTDVIDDAEQDSIVNKIVSISGGTGTGTINAGSATTFPNTGISFGRWDGNPSLAGEDFDGQFGPPSANPARAVLGAFNWIKGPELWPFYLASALTQTATYAFDGGSVTDQFGTPGVFNTGTNLTAHFGNSSVDFNLDVTLPPRLGTSARNFVIQGQGIRMDDSGGWFASSSHPLGTATHNNLSTASLNGTGASASVNGQITGAGASGALMSFGALSSDFSAPSPFPTEMISGVAAFATTAPSGGLGTLSTYRLGLLGLGLDVTGAAAIKASYLYQLEGGANAPSQIELQNGFPVAFNASMPLACDAVCAGMGTPFVNDIPARFSILPADVATVNTALGTSFSPASIVDSGRDLETGTVWGRYAGGHIALIDRIDPATGTKRFLDATTQSRHFLLTGSQAGPTALPLTGTASYTLVGATSPTDNSGNLGTLGSVTLNVDFANKLVTTLGINASIAGNAWAANAANLPIQKGMFFEAERTISGTGALNVTATNIASGSPLGGSTAGTVTGAFTGPTGRGAGLGYSLHNTSLNTTVTGVAALRR